MYVEAARAVIAAILAVDGVHEEEGIAQVVAILAEVFLLNTIFSLHDRRALAAVTTRME
jgi:hypothetical protein